MDKFKKFLLWLKVPKLWFGILFSVFAIIVMAGTITLVCFGFSENIIAYFLYFLSAICLIYFVYLIVITIPKIKYFIIKTLKKHEFTAELLESYGYRSVIFASFSFMINMIYAVLQAVLAIYSKSVWLGILAFYYIVLSLMRGGVLAVSRKRRKDGDKVSINKQVKTYRDTGIYMLVLNFALLGAIIQMVITNQGFEYAGLMIYVMATYTFYKLGISIYNIIKVRKHNDHILQSIKNISFADSLVSILALQNALLSAFSSGQYSRLANLLTGGAIFATIFVMSIIIIASANRTFKKLNEGREYEQEI